MTFGQAGDILDSDCALCGGPCEEPMISHYPGGDYKPAPARGRDALDSQEAGDHYCMRAIQPIEYALANNFNYWESMALKYLTRHRQKNGVEDLRKAIHCIELGIEAEYDDRK